MREVDALVVEYVHLDRLPRSSDALRSLQKIASLVKPIMRTRGWTVGTLAEFCPEEHNLLGLNINRGAKICLRLRYHGDKTQFLPLEQVIDTMLHELSHNVFGPHDGQFHNLWNELRDEYTDLKLKGYTGEGFLSEGQRLGGRRIPVVEMRRQARAAAEQRKLLQKKSGQKLGGRAVPRNFNIREVIAEAATKRTRITQGCASNAIDVEEIAAEATRNGFRTQAEEDQANERAIAEALWELAQEEAAVDAGLDAPRNNPDHQAWSTEGLVWNPETGLEIPQSSRAGRSNGSEDKRLPLIPQYPTSGSRSISAHSKQRSRSPMMAWPTEKARTRQLQTASRPRDLHPALRQPPLSAPPTAPLPSPPNPRVSPISVSSHGSLPMSGYPAPSPSTSSSYPSPPTPYVRPAVPASQTRQSSPPLSRLVTDQTPPRKPHRHAETIDLTKSPDRIIVNPNRNSLPSATSAGPATPLSTPTNWTCPNCTLANPHTFLCCGACATEKPCHGRIEDFSSLDDMGPAFMGGYLDSPLSAVELTTGHEFPSTGRGLASSNKGLGWNCQQCGSFMEHKWWTCSNCGLMKAQS